MLPEWILLIGEIIFYVVELVEMIMKSDLGREFKEWFRERPPPPPPPPTPTTTPEI